MSGLRIVVPGSFWDTAGWATGAALARRTFVGSATRAFWIDPSDITTLFQDRSGTIPVTANGDPVSFARDKSGLGQDLILHPNAPGQPTYGTDGFKHWIEIPPGGGDFEVANPLRQEGHSLVAAVRWTGSTDADRWIVSQDGTSQSDFLALQCLRSDGVLSANIETASGFELEGATQLVDGADYVLSYTLNVDTPSARLRVNGVDDALNASFTPNEFASEQTTTRVFTNSPRSEFTSGRLYGLAFARADRDVGDVEAVLAERAGVTLG